MASGADRPQAKSVFVWQWGRRGAGPRLAYELAGALAVSTDLSPLLSLSDKAELLAGAEGGLRLGIPIAFEAPSVLRTSEYAKLLLTLPSTLSRLRTFLTVTRPVAAICVMPGYFDVLVARILNALGIPLITVVHDAVKHPGEPYRFLLQLQPLLIRRSQAVVTLSQHVAGELARQGLMDGVAHAVIPHPALSFPDLGLGPPAAPAYPDRRPLSVLMAGRLHAYKGLEVFLDALSVLEPRPIRGRIVGRGGDDALLRRAQALTNCTVENRWLSEADLVREIDASDVVVTPYVEASQSGIVALAFARGRPVVTTPVGGLVEQVRHEVNGLVAECTTSHAVARCLDRLLDDIDLYRLCAGGAKASGQLDLSWDKLAPAYAHLISAMSENAAIQSTVRSHA